MKWKYLPAALLFALVGTLAYFAATGPTLDNQWKGCPNVTWKMPQGNTFGAEQEYRFKVDQAIAQIERQVPIVTMAKWSDPEAFAKETLLGKQLPRDVHEAEVMPKTEGTHMMW